MIRSLYVAALLSALPLAACGMGEENSPDTVAPPPGDLAVDSSALEPVCTLLSHGVPLTGISGAAGSKQYFCVDVPATHYSSYALSGGTGDADLYVKAGSAPTTTTYDCRPYKMGNAEACSITAKTGNVRVYIMLNGYSSFSGVSLVAYYN